LVVVINTYNHSNPNPNKNKKIEHNRRLNKNKIYVVQPKKGNISENILQPIAIILVSIILANREGAKSFAYLINSSFLKNYIIILSKYQNILII